ncbi:MAG: hypoxanthine phosphoribosyltransferase [Pirellulaceae bacterium]|nr:MAG: hypoxanthine phosphoribosyltransferase [Pirellulaceae bacterium]
MKQLIDEDTIRARVAALAQEIADTYGQTPITIVGIMTGSLLFLADLVRHLSMPLRVGVLQATSYRGNVDPGELHIYADGLLDIQGREVLLVDDIFDTGRTLVETMRHLEKFQPASIRSAVLLLKKGKQQVDYRPDFTGFEIPDVFVVGYGLDYRDLYRNLPYVAALEPGELAEKDA